MRKYDFLVMDLNGFHYIQDFFGNALESGTARVAIPPQANKQFGTQVQAIAQAIGSMVGVLNVANVIIYSCSTASFNFVVLSIVQIQIMLFQVLIDVRMPASLTIFCSPLLDSVSFNF